MTDRVCSGRFRVLVYGDCKGFKVSGSGSWGVQKGLGFRAQVYVSGELKRFQGPSGCQRSKLRTLTTDPRQFKAAPAQSA